MKLLSRLRRRSAPESEPQPAPAPGPRNPRTYADDLAEALGHEAELAAEVKWLRQLLDESESARLRRAAEQRAVAAEERAQELAELLAKVRADRDGLRRQLDNALYDSAALAAIDAGTGQPRKA